MLQQLLVATPGQESHEIPGARQLPASSLGTFLSSKVFYFFSFHLRGESGAWGLVERSSTCCFTPQMP